MFASFKNSAGSDAKVAIVFVHGFTGDCRGTWGEIPDLLGKQPALAGWDLFGFGYESKRRFDIRNLWTCDAGLEEVATMLVSTPELSGYERVAFVAHSMGGLVVQRALIQSDGLRGRTSHVVLFGTPSAGLTKARPLAALKQQIRDMNASGDFIRQLRSDWKARGLDQPRFHFLAVAGERDQFVPPASSIYPFGEAFRAVIPGDHLTMLETSAALEAPVVKVLTEMLTQGAAVAGPRSAAALAIEEGRFQQAIDQLWPVRAGLDHAGTTLLAMALDARHRRQDAIDVLRARGDSDIDTLGVLAGRYKRQWLVNQQEQDLERATELYQKGYEAACAEKNAGQCFYHGINLGYLKLATERLAEAKTLAGAVLQHCADYATLSQKDMFWRLASEGDAFVILGQKHDGLAKHAQAAALKIQPWQALSMEEQAVRVADLCGWSEAEQDQLADLYLPHSCR
jgi:pimeloyl-ACP methyl ester carboxylesterase